MTAQDEIDALRVRARRKPLRHPRVPRVGGTAALARKLRFHAQSFAGRRTSVASPGLRALRWTAPVLAHFQLVAMNELDSLVESARQRFAQSTSPADLENATAQFLGKSGRVTELMKGMAQLCVAQKKTRGAAINLAKQAIEAALNARRQALADAQLQQQLTADALDVSLPGRQRGQGGLHPVSLT